VAALAHRAVRASRAGAVDAGTVDAGAAPVGVPGARPAAVTVVQALWRLLEIGVGSAAAYLTVFVLGPLIADRIGLSLLILLLPVIAMLAPIVLSPLAVLATVLAKRLLIGRYRPGSTPVWSGAYLRMWIVARVAGFIPWRTIAGTELQSRVLRALGARIGERVHLHRGVDVHHGGWDLLEIGDDVTVGQDAALRVVHLEQGHVVLGRVTVADGATLDVRAGVAPDTRVGRNAWLSALSSLPSGGSIPDGETWDGVPARRVGPAPEPPPLDHAARSLSPLAHGLVMILATGLVRSLPGLPAVLALAALAQGIGLSYATALSWFTDPGSHLALLAAGAVLLCLSGIAGVWSQALVARALGRVGEAVISRWSLAYVRVWIKTGLVTSANEWLSGGLFWPVWLRWAGMRIGRDAEISTITDTVPELVEIGPRTFLADGIYLGGPRVHRGTVTLRATILSRNTFLGNHVVVAGGQWLPADLLLGVCTVADDRAMGSGTSWFGHPAFELPRREVVELDRGLTHEPSTLRVVNRVFWEWLRFAVPLVPAAVGVGWLAAAATAAARLGVVPLLLVALPVLALASEVALALFVLALKWVLLGRVRPGVHGLWSCWCSRWDFLYVAWGKIASRVLSPLEGTLLLPVYLRAMGMRIGRRVVLGDGFAQVVDPDMIEIEEGATVSAMFQAHTFEDRVLKIDQVRIGAGATLAEGTVPLYGADVGERTTVCAHSVIMKRERLLPDARYEGVPTRCTESAR
jgi:non-ribosomal peptide synthetase-like protein